MLASGCAGSARPHTPGSVSPNTSSTTPGRARSHYRPHSLTPPALAPVQPRPVVAGHARSHCSPVLAPYPAMATPSPDHARLGPTAARPPWQGRRRSPRWPRHPWLDVAATVPGLALMGQCWSSPANSTWSSSKHFSRLEWDPRSKLELLQGESADLDPIFQTWSYSKHTLGSSSTPIHFNICVLT